MATANPFGYNEHEEQLARLEKSWADFIAGARTEIRLRRTEPGRLISHCDSLPRVHATLEDYRDQYEKGDNYALLRALECCCQENVPLPYWAADGLQKTLQELMTQPVSIHSLLHVDKHFRASGKRARKDREERERGIRLWAQVRELMDGEERLSRDSAITRVLNTGGLPFRKSTAIRLFEKIDAAQQRHLKIRRET